MKIRRMLCLLWLLPLTVLAAPSPLTPQVVEYQVKYGSFSLGGARFTLAAPQGNTYHYEMDSDLSLIVLSDKRKITSVFTDVDGQLQPLRFIHERTGTGKDFNEQIAFARDQGKVFSVYKGEKTKLNYTDTLYDAMMLQLQFRLDLMNGKQKFNYKMVKDNEIEDYHFRNLGQETVKLPSGSYQTVHLELIRKSQKRHTDVWMAPDLGYLPVRFVHEEKGNTMELTLKQVQFSGATGQAQLAKTE
ncbi:DUF3108 domain-containing protein [Shewanella sp. A32]|uniref:DUF3108 domain-containing protein n=1 Tax=Shewanella TaxID=22 RepID=UPI001E409B76|nr:MULTISPECIES: DUF3108 domain-containing protein [Shewanella]MDF0535785.1 DUF3108 domain-containing protein [Shewanella sp. A32]